VTSPPAAIDEAIAACLVDQSETSFRRVAGLGPEGLLRLHDIYYRRAAWAAPDLKGAGRELADVWNQMLFELALANPSSYLDQIAARRLRLTTLEVVILGHIDDERAVALLVHASRHSDWLIRYHAVRGLVARDDLEATAAVERAAKQDCSVNVRVEATAGVARRDRARARTLYLGLLDHPHMTPMLRRQIEAMLEK
jgi:HEAT repeat protein